ncbi:hypothetical protein G5714_007520 [Onychostoma macrolepis]|uniref:Astrocytic phosphoprotein PEA-15 n=1 Tax=Onychostoma macrolepis TaxID=369639 RepID=A0A7J6CT20_9TELE|nr:hypothetical protein G5714_007520 [Onychostoma macrolepis]
MAAFFAPGVSDEARLNCGSALGLIGIRLAFRSTQLHACEVSQSKLGHGSMADCHPHRGSHPSPPGASSSSSSSSPDHRARGRMSEYSSMLSDLSENITNEDLEQLKSACKEDIPEDQSNSITSSKDWFSYLEKNDKLAQDNLFYIEHIFEISRRPDLLTRVIEYRTTVLKISEDDEIDTKLTRIPSAKKYKDIIRQPSEDEIIKLAPPPKKA